MARPAISRLFDSTVRVWRAIVQRSSLGVDEREYYVVDEFGARMNRSTAPVSDVGPGLDVIGRRRFYLEPDADVQVRDILEITEGPDAVQTWEVDEPPTRPSGHHTQVDCIVWAGNLPTEES